jgi:hypothetical protein
MGDLFGVPITFGGGVTVSTEYMRIIDKRNLLNVRYLVRPASAPDPGPVYQDAAWKVYENPGGASRAWLVHETMSIPAGSPLPGFDPSQTALVDSGMDIPLEPKAPAAGEIATFSTYEANRIALKVHAQTRALLVLSETFDPGWRATVNGTRESTYRVDGDLRGIVVPAGDSQIVLTYAPRSFYLGTALTLLAFFGTAFLWVHGRRKPG